MPHFLACVSKHQKMLNVHTSDHETKRGLTSGPRECLPGDGGGEMGSPAWLKQDGYLWISIMQPWTWRCSHAQRKHVYLQLLSGCFLSVSAIHTKWGPRGAMAGLSS